MPPPSPNRSEIRIAVVHCYPLEDFPPVKNLLTHLAATPGISLETHSSRPRFKQTEFNGPEGARLRIFRSPNPSAGKPWPAKYLAYATFQLATFWRLVRQQPAVILYYEPVSAFPVWLYSLLKPRVPVLIHHHEYHSPDQFFRPGMRLIRLFHKLEKRSLFPRARWVSQTNATRLSLFTADCPELRPEICKILPNYPPSIWREGQNTAWLEKSSPFRFVYAGSLSLKDTFLREFVEWLLALPAGRATLDIFAYNLDAETRGFLESLDASPVRFHADGVHYDDLPDLLRRFHAGLVLYRAETLNFRYNETNKLFEYLARGLDVWYSDRMEGIHPHARIDAVPRVIRCDFTAMADGDLTQYFERPAGMRRAEPYPSAEEAFAPLVESLLESASR